MIAAFSMLLLGLMTPPTLPPPVDPRNVEVLRYGCSNELGRREITLFANGTVRLRDGEPGKEWMGLSELGPDELQAYLNRLGEEDFEKADRMPQSVEGQWVEKCELSLQLADKPLRHFEFGRYDSLPLNLSRVLRIAEDLAAEVDDLKGAEQLPVDYEPRRGDILKRVDGQLFRVFGFTVDNKGLEMHGVTQPITLYVLVEEVRKEFVAVVRRRK